MYKLTNISIFVCKFTDWAMSEGGKGAQGVLQQFYKTPVRSDMNKLSSDKKKSQIQPEGPIIH